MAFGGLALYGIFHLIETAFGPTVFRWSRVVLIGSALATMLYYDVSNRGDGESKTLVRTSELVFAYFFLEFLGDAKEP